MRSIVGIIGLLPALALAQLEVHELKTRPEVTLRFVYSKAPGAFASAVLFQGGGGAIGIFPMARYATRTSFPAAPAVSMTTGSVSPSSTCRPTGGFSMIFAIPANTLRMPPQ
jgi:hypothetical protein